MKPRIFLIISLVCASAPAARAQTSTLERLGEPGRRDAQAQAAYGRALLEAGRLDEAERALRRAARLEDNSVEALYELAKVSFQRGDLKRAKAACGALRRADRKAALTHVCYARAFLMWRRSGRAFEHVQDALEVDPDHVEALIALGDAHRFRADVEEAKKAYLRALEKKPGRAGVHVKLGQLLLLHDSKAALGHLRKALELDPASPVALLELGRAVGGSEGLRLIERAARERPRWDEARRALAEAKLAAGDLEGAERLSRTLLAENDRSATAQLVLGQSLAARKDYDAAEQALQRALELTPNSAVAAHTLADVYAATQRYEDALEQYRIAAGLAPRDNSALLDAARLSLRLSRPVLASGFLDKALARTPGDREALSLRSKVQAQLDKRR